MRRSTLLWRDFARPMTRTTCSTRWKLRRITIPAPALETINAPLLAINSDDDLINPPDLDILQTEIKRVPHGRAVFIPESDQTVGHGSHTKAVLWKKDLVQFLKETEPRQ